MHIHRRNKDIIKKRAKRGKFKFPYFYVIYGTLMVASFIAIFYGVAALSSFLYDYENALPKYVAEDIFGAYYAPCDFDKIYDTANCEVSPFDGKDGFIRYMEQVTDGRQITYREVSAGLGDIKKFIIKADDLKFSEFTLKKSGVKNAHGFDLWELDSMTAFYKTEKSISVKALTNSTVYINDILLTDEFKISDEIPTESSKYLPEGVPGISYVVYKVDGLLNEPEATTQDRDGKPSALIYNEDDKHFAEQINYDKDLEALLSEYVITAAQTYAKYMTNDAWLSNLRTYFDTSTKIYELLRTSEVYWYTPHIGYEFEGSEVSEFYAYSDDVFSCRYTGTQYIHRTKTETFTYPLNLSLYFRKINDKYLIFELISNE